MLDGIDALAENECPAVRHSTTFSQPFMMNALRLPQAYEAAVSQVPGFNDRITPLGSVGLNAGGSLPDTTLVSGRLSVLCSHADPAKDSSNLTSGCVDSPTSSLKYLLLDHMDLPSNTALTVTPATVPPSLAAPLVSVLGFDPAVNELPTDDTAWDSACPGYSTYNVYLSTQDPRLAKAVSDGLQALAKDPSPILDALKEQQQQQQDAAAQPAFNLCGASLTVTGNVTIPGSNQPAWRPSAATDVTWASVSIGDGVNPTPPTRLTIGDDYSVFLSNFPQVSGANTRHTGVERVFESTYEREVERVGVSGNERGVLA